MKKLNKVAMLIASAALATAAGAQTVDNWKNGTNELVWKNGTNELCWRDASWTPTTAAPTAMARWPLLLQLPLPLLRLQLPPPLHLLHQHQHQPWPPR